MSIRALLPSENITMQKREEAGLYVCALAARMVHARPADIRCEAPLTAKAKNERLGSCRSGIASSAIVPVERRSQGDSNAGEDAAVRHHGQYRKLPGSVDSGGSE